MQMDPITLPVPTPLAQKAIIHLIGQELKSRKLFGGLRDLGLDDDFYQADLIEVIMTSIGIPPESHDEFYSYCYDLIGKHSDRVVRDDAVLLDEAERVFLQMLKHAMLHLNKQLK